jgi:hypothetical protein
LILIISVNTNRESVAYRSFNFTSIKLEVPEKLPQGLTKELTCGSQAIIATLLFDPSMSALPIIEKHKSQRVGLFTR